MLVEVYLEVLVADTFQLLVDGDITRCDIPSKNKAFERLFEFRRESKGEMLLRGVCSRKSVRVFVVVAEVHVDLACIILPHDEFGRGIGHHFPCGSGIRDKDAYYIS